jgi:hypothetical protein
MQRDCFLQMHIAAKPHFVQQSTWLAMDIRELIYVLTANPDGPAIIML